ncbi:MAG: helix-turn-helix domain-containing protein [Sphingobium sp.]
MEQMLISIPDACTMLSVKRSTIYRLIDKKKLDVVKIGARTLVRVSSIRKMAGEAEI